MSRPLPNILPPGPQHSYRLSAAYESSSAPSTLSPQTPSSGGIGMNILGTQLAKRLNSDNRPQYQQPVQLSPMADNGPRYRGEYEQMAGSPPIPDSFAMNRMIVGSPATPHSHHGGPLQAHKRAYRQRRKDPSCDACRERKVKACAKMGFQTVTNGCQCDATDTSSCSECSSRNVKCQFTKDTNRRMTSIKQVQDLEKQLLVARQQVSQLRSIVKTDATTADDDDFSSGPGASKRRKLTESQNVLSIQRNMEEYGHGIIKAPYSAEQSRASPVIGISLPELPAKPVGEHLLRNYHAMMYTTYPSVDWTSVTTDFEQLYSERPLRGLSTDACAVIFAILACGSIRDGDDAANGKRYFEASRSLLQWCTEKPSLDLIRASLLCTVYLTETNQRTAAFGLIGYVVRVAQDIGVHHKTGLRSLGEEESRYRLWWSIFCAERYLSFELGRPTMINDEDCEPSDEPKSATTTPTSPSESSQLDFMVSVARTIPHIQKAFKAPVISAPILVAIHEEITNCTSALPPDYLHLDSNQNQGPSSPTMYLLSARILLHRHNLSPASPPDAKLIAIEECMAAARETIRILSRTVQDPSSQSPVLSESTTAPRLRWEANIRMGSSAFLCLHIFRCTLFLAGSGDFENALICARSSAAIGSHRVINNSCGRYLAFFLDIVWEKATRGGGHLANFGDDDELLAYVSADLQSNLDQAWIWQSAVVGKAIATDRPRNGYGRALGGSPPEAETREWDGWKGIVDILRRLSDDQRRQPKPSEEKHYSNAQEASMMAPAPRLDAALTPGPSISPGPSNRMSIADLI